MAKDTNTTAIPTGSANNEEVVDYDGQVEQKKRF